MDNPAQIFDRRLLRLRKARAAAGMERAAFLIEHVAIDLAERLSLISRQFATGLDLGAHGTVLSDRIMRTGKVGRMLRAVAVSQLAGRADGAAIVADEELLPFAPASLDIIVSGLSLQLVNDLPGALVQIRRALKPDGLFMGSLLGGRTLEQLRSAFASAEITLTGGLSPRVAPFADIRDLGALLQRAGFALPVADAEALTITYCDPADLMADLKTMGTSNALRERRKTLTRRGLIGAACEAYRQQFGQTDGRVPATFDIVTLTGWAPHHSQQKPLQPGSARTSLKATLEAGQVSVQGNLKSSSHGGKD